MADEGWEARMAERARSRAVVAEAEAITRQAVEPEPATDLACACPPGSPVRLVILDASGWHCATCDTTGWQVVEA